MFGSRFLDKSSTKSQKALESRPMIQVLYFPLSIPQTIRHFLLLGRENWVQLDLPSSIGAYALHKWLSSYCYPLFKSRVRVNALAYKHFSEQVIASTCFFIDDSRSWNDVAFHTDTPIGGLSCFILLIVQIKWKIVS